MDSLPPQMDPPCYPEELRLLTQDLRGKVALVTGASRGIGRAILVHLAVRGASILGTCSSTTSLDLMKSLKRTIEQLYSSSDLEVPKIVGLAANLLSTNYSQLIADKIHDEFGGKLNIIVNNAAYGEFRPFGELDADYVQRVLLGNVQSLVLMELLFNEGYIQPGSRIVNISTDGTRSSLPFPGFMLFASTKAAMESLTRSWADILSLDEKTFGTTVNALSVGGTAIDTLMNNNTPRLKAAALRFLGEGKTIHNRFARPEDIANIAGLVVSEASHWMNGSVVAASGGAVKIL